MAFLFKKKNNPKQIVDGLLQHINALPSKSKVEAVAKVAVANAEESQTGTASGKAVSAPFSSRRANVDASSGSEEVTQSAPASADGAVGVGDGLSPNDLAALDGLEKRMAELNVLLCGTADTPPKEDESSQLATLLLEADVPMSLLSKLGSVTFETRKSIVIVFNYLLQVQEPLELQKAISRYLRPRAKEIIRLLLSYYSMENLALHAGAMMRQCLLHQSLYQECLSDDMVVLNLFFDTFLQMDSFEICSDAFATFRDILTKQKHFVSEFLEKNYARFFPKYTALLQSEQYVTQRQRQNYNTMIRFIGDKQNLMLVMNLMRVKSPAMRLEAFHVFKIFVANPHKTPEITEILQRNRDKLVAYLKNFTTEREDENFQEERKLLIRTMVALPQFEKKDGASEATGASGASA